MVGTSFRIPTKGFLLYSHRSRGDSPLRGRPRSLSPPIGRRDLVSNPHQRISPLFLSEQGGFAPTGPPSVPFSSLGSAGPRFESPPKDFSYFFTGAGGIRTPDTLLGYNSLAGSHLRPLGHHSKSILLQVRYKIKTIKSPLSFLSERGGFAPSGPPSVPFSSLGSAGPRFESPAAIFSLLLIGERGIRPFGAALGPFLLPRVGGTSFRIPRSYIPSPSSRREGDSPLRGRPRSLLPPKGRRDLVSNPPQLYSLSFLSERGGFEPPEPCGSTVFETDRFDHSRISPLKLSPASTRLRGFEPPAFRSAI